jgi:PPE-repeat protein
MDFGALPPEINSGRMYSGPGSGPMLAAAAAWGGLAAELGSTASSYDSVISALTGEAWSGPTAASMTAAVTPYMAWMNTTATQAEQAAVQASAAASAYETAFTATVPPPTIAANRSLLMSLIATNVLGQNTAAIAATEAHYAEMWAQDAAAMYGYAGASANATDLTPFTAPPSTTNPAGLGAQTGAVSQAVGASTQTTLSQLMSAVPQTLQGLAASGPSTAAQAEPPLFSFLDFLSGPTGPTAVFSIGGVPYLLAFQDVLLPMNGANVLGALARADALAAAAGEVAPSHGGPGAGMRLVNSPGPSGAGSTVSAGIGNAGSVGRLSVPQSWAAVAPAVKPVAAVLPSAGPEAAPMVAAESQSGLLSDVGLGGLAGRAIGATGGSASCVSGRTKAAKAESKPTIATIIVIPPSAED